jgi:hypothetical protein
VIVVKNWNVKGDYSSFKNSMGRQAVSEFFSGKSNRDFFYKQNSFDQCITGCASKSFTIGKG